MKGSVLKVLAALLFLGGVPSLASASTINIGLFTLNDDGSSTFFGVVNLTGPTSSLPPDYPIETALTIDTSTLSLTATLNGGGTITIPGTGFFTSDADGNVNCTTAGDAGAAIDPGCNFAAYQLTSATLTGTLSPTSGLVGLPSGFIGIQSAFTVTLLPTSGNDFLTAGDFVDLQATLIPGERVPEPSTLMLLPFGMGLVARYRLRRHMPPRRRFDRRGE
jgi:hypothetical protein